MKMMKIYIAVLATVAIAAPSTAFRPGDNWAPGAPGSGPPNANRDPDHIVCQVRGVTGSRARSVRICMTNGWPCAERRLRNSRAARKDQPRINASTSALN
jgi:hypothetical protein